MNDPFNESVSFLQHVLPGLEDGTYQLTLSQNVNDSSGAPISDDSLTHTYTFAVLGDRFTLQRPSDVVFSTFPDDQASGELTTVLPHVVFLKPSFPWARYPTNTPPAAPPPGGDTDADVPTWLAVLLFDEDDLALFPALTLVPANRTIGDLITTAINPASSLGDNYSYFFQDTSMPTLEIGQTRTTPIRTIDIPLPLFWQTCPSLSDLALLAHVREVSLVTKPTNTGAVSGEPTGQFSIVFGNRFAQTEKKAYAYLVSLEEMEDLLPNSDGTPPSGSFDNTRFVRLAVLQSWTYFSTGETATFVDQLLALNGRTGSGDASDTTLTVPYAGSNILVQNGLSMGYVPLDHQLRTPATAAQQTVSWYRGPLVPYDTAPPELDLPIASPDQLTIFDPTTGMLDVSYAAAWTLGRQLALQNTAFSTALYGWKKGLTQDVVNAIELEILDEALQPVLDGGESLFRRMLVSLKERVPS
jgi:hypothetical protein